MAKVDDLGIEIDEELERALSDPKAGILTKVVDYLTKRRAKEKEIEDQKKEKENKPKSIFGDLFQ